MYLKVTDKHNNVFLFKIMKDKKIHYGEKKNDFWRVVNVTTGSILVPTFDSTDDAMKFLKNIKSWKVEEIDLTKLNMLKF